MNYELALENYKGPLDKLLELVEEKKMEITLVNLAAVTGDFLDYLKKMENKNADYSLVADFLNIASKLLLIKSKILLPSLVLDDEEKEDIRDLERRLKIYQEFKKTNAFIKSGWSDIPRMASREFLSGMGSVFYPPAQLTSRDFLSAMVKISGELEMILKPKTVIKREIINLKAKIEEILKKLSEKPINFENLRIEKTRGELVVLFLAILHLLKNQLIYAEQSNHFEEIKIAKTL